MILPIKIWEKCDTVLNDTVSRLYFFLYYRVGSIFLKRTPCHLGFEGIKEILEFKECCMIVGMRDITFERP